MPAFADRAAHARGLRRRHRRVRRGVREEAQALAGRVRDDGDARVRGGVFAARRRRRSPSTCRSIRAPARLDEAVLARWLPFDPCRACAWTKQAELGGCACVISIAAVATSTRSTSARASLRDRMRELGLEVRHEEFDDDHRNVGYRYEVSLPALAAVLDQRMMNRLVLIARPACARSIPARPARAQDPPPPTPSPDPHDVQRSGDELHRAAGRRCSLGRRYHPAEPARRRSANRRRVGPPPRTRGRRERFRSRWNLSRARPNSGRAQFESQTAQRGRRTALLIRNKTPIALLNGMPAYFVEVTSGSGFDAQKEYASCGPTAARHRAFGDVRGSATPAPTTRKTSLNT